MAEYGGWVTLGDSSPKPPEKSGSWLKPIHLTKSELLRYPALRADWHKKGIIDMGYN